MTSSEFLLIDEEPNFDAVVWTTCHDGHAPVTFLAARECQACCARRDLARELLGPPGRAISWETVVDEIIPKLREIAGDSDGE